MTKLPVVSASIPDPRLSLAIRPQLPIPIRTMHVISQKLSADPDRRADVARAPRRLLEQSELAAAIPDATTDAPWFVRMDAVHARAFLAADDDSDPVVNVNAAINVNAAMNVNAATKVNVATAANAVVAVNAVVANKAVLVNENWVFGREAAAPTAWDRVEPLAAGLL